MEQPKKYIKVKVSERLPELDEIVTMVLDNGESCAGCFIANDYWYSIEISNHPDMPEYWLEEVPDRESELIEMLETVTKELEEKQGHTSAITSASNHLIQSVKQPK